MTFTQKRKQKKKSKELGNNTLHEAYETMFNMVEYVITNQGFIDNQIMGLEIRNGKIIGVHDLPVKDENIDLTPVYIEKLLEQFPMVVHVFEAWTAPDTTVKPSEHPDRKDTVQMMFYTEASVHVSTCQKDVENNTVTKGELIRPDEIGGRLTKHTPTTH
jgi:hypothetical protein